MALLLGCGFGSEAVIDTWPIGDPLECADAAYCEEQVRVGLKGLAQRDPGHAPVISTALHLVGTCFDPETGKALMFTRSGWEPDVLVVRLADGSRHAIGVGGAGIDHGPFAHDWYGGRIACGNPPPE